MQALHNNGSFDKICDKDGIEDASGKILTTVSLASTGGNEIWKTASAKGIHLKKGENKIRIYFENDGVNLNYFEVR